MSSTLPPRNSNLNDPRSTGGGSGLRDPRSTRPAARTPLTDPRSTGARRP